MLEYIEREANYTYTENGAVTHATTGSDCLDLFATVGALRSAEDKEIINRFVRAYAEDPDLAAKILFYARDVRGGLGERHVFRTVLRWLSENRPETVKKNIEHIAEFGRWDDLLILLGTPCEAEMLACIRTQLEKDLVGLQNDSEISLLGKWLPSVNASNPETICQAKRIAGKLGYSDAAYRKMLSALRAKIRILENDLREKDYTFDYEKQPSKAMFKYRKAFFRNDGERYGAFIRRVSDGKAVLHTGTLTPYEIIRPLLGLGEYDSGNAIDATWNAQEDFTNGENALVVIDGSGSMYSWTEPMPASVALSLGIYFAERNTGMFKNHFITFSHNPQLVEIKGKNIREKVDYCKRFNEVADTNIQKVFELVLRAAVKNNVPQSEMPSTLYIISDMEFNCCAQDANITNFEYAKKIFAEAGYELPRVVFWNVQSRNLQQPVTQNEQGVVLVSGCTPRIFSMVTEGKLSPVDYMLEVLNNPRYAKIAA